MQFWYLVGTLYINLLTDVFDKNLLTNVVKIDVVGRKDGLVNWLQKSVQAPNESMFESKIESRDPT